MKVAKWFESWECLKDTEGHWNYARIMGMISLLLIQPSILIYLFSANYLELIKSAWQWLTVCIPSLTSIALFLIEIIRDKNSLKIHVGDRQYGFEEESASEGA
jgi:hypothetical protein